MPSGIKVLDDVAAEGTCSVGVAPISVSQITIFRKKVSAPTSINSLSKSRCKNSSPATAAKDALPSSSLPRITIGATAIFIAFDWSLSWV